ncbi:DegT/DnrJ/EryC1/StrS family aminotransferase [Alphaproteobacteria bacterium]|nr:DegT/DnrJ/EryC1/StrS family aminotransferase [Alphaproteobacteria bacterium]
MKKINISEPLYDKNEILNVNKVIKSGWVTQGPVVNEFENLFKKIHKVKYAVAVSNCTAGLHLMLLAAGIKKGDEVIIPSFTWVSLANVIVQVGAKPVLVDVDRSTYNLTYDYLINKINNNTKAIFVVHLFGLCVDVNYIKKKISKNIIIFEDCACAVGSKFKNAYAGSLGLAGSFSFHPRKSITTGEGGIVTTNNKKFADKIIMLRNHGAEISEEKRYKSNKSYVLSDFILPGLNYRLTDIQGALGLAQLKKIKQILNFRNKWAKYYLKNLKNIEWIELPFIPKNAYHSWQAFVIKINKKYAKKINRDDILKFLLKNSIGARPGTHSIHSLSYYKKKYKFNDKDFKNSLYCHLNTIALPLHNKMKKSDFNYVIKLLKSI